MLAGARVLGVPVDDGLELGRRIFPLFQTAIGLPEVVVHLPLPVEFPERLFVAGGRLFVAPCVVVDGADVVVLVGGR